MSSVHNGRMAAIAGIPQFWESVRAAPHRLLALDYDGTLAPFQKDRDRATLLPGIRDAIERIRNSEKTTMAIISGRPVAEITTLVGSDLRVSLYGAHGYEWIQPDGTMVRIQVKPEHEAALRQAWNDAVEAGIGEFLEHKTASIALHTRDHVRARHLEVFVRGLWMPIAAKYGLYLDHFNGGIELRSSTRNKGNALADLLMQSPPGTLPVYIGDDVTDEDAFRFVERFGIGIKVGSSESPTAASGRVNNCEDVLRTLQTWTEWIV